MACPVGFQEHSHSSVLVSFRTRQALHLLHSGEEKMFHRSALAQGLSHLLELV